jgi:hypothetical protein
MANSQVQRFSGKDASGEVLNQYETPLRFTTVDPNSAESIFMKSLCIN